MRYNIDQAFIEGLSYLPELSIKNPIASRLVLTTMAAEMDAELDVSGVSWSDCCIEGGEGAPEVTLRIYRPDEQPSIGPGLLYIHGGGFVIGDLESEHGTCVFLCRQLGITLVSTDYRKAPESPYPGGLDDCYTALGWVSANAHSLAIDPERLGVFGQSAGAGLAAATTLLARDRQGPAICFQYLGMPELDDRLETPSMQQFVDTPIWNRPNAELSWAYYLGDQYQRGGSNIPGYAAPARADDLSGLPPAHVTTMEFDPLRDEGVLYALRLMQAGVRTELHSYPGTFHGSVLFSHAPVSQRELTEMVTVLRNGLLLD